MSCNMENAVVPAMLHSPIFGVDVLTLTTQPVILNRREASDFGPYADKIHVVFVVSTLSVWLPGLVNCCGAVVCGDSA